MRISQIKITSFVLMLYLFAGLAARSQSDTLTIIHVNDTHSQLLPYASGRYGGIARAATIIREWIKNEPNAIFVHVGDFMVGTLMFNTYFGVPELEILKGLRCDALVLGNHEFDLGPAKLAEVLAKAGLDSQIAVLSTNARNLSQLPELDSLVKPFVIKLRGGVKVGLFGLTTPTTNVESRPAPIFLDTGLVRLARDAVERLKSAGCQVIIMLSHLGISIDKELAPYLSDVDAIVGGHSHTSLEEVIYVNEIPIVQAGEFYNHVGKLKLEFDGHRTRVLDYTLQDITESIPADSAVAARVAELKEGVVQKYNSVLGNPYQTLGWVTRWMSHSPQKKDTLDTPVGNLVTDAMLSSNYVGEADCALEPTGHIVEDLYPGDLSFAQLFRIYPYGYDDRDGLGFRMTSFQLSGSALREILQRLSEHIDFEKKALDYLQQGANIKIIFQESRRGLKLEQVFIAGRVLEVDSIYTIVSSDRVIAYIQELFHLSPVNLKIYPVSVVQVVGEYVARLKEIDKRSRGNIQLIREIDNHDEN